jgi:hypothetical protein
MRAGFLVIMAFLAVLTACRPSTAAPLCSQETRDERALGVINSLADKGYIPEGSRNTFKGERQLSRWEIALQLAELLQTVEEGSMEYSELIAVMHQYIKELKTLGLRIGTLERKGEELDRRVTKLERITFYGNIHTIFIAQTVAGDSLSGLLATNNIDWVTGRPLTRGVGFTGNLGLGANLKVNESLKADVRLAGFFSQGDNAVDMYWGVTPPFLANPFTSMGGSGANIQSVDHTPVTRTVLDKVSLDFTRSGMLLEAGSFNPGIIPQGLVMGMRNPALSAPSILPFYGASFGRRQEKGNNFEIFYARLPQINVVSGGNSLAYYTWLGGAGYTIPLKKGKITLGYARMINEMDRTGAAQGVGIATLPQLPWTVMWFDPRSGGSLRTSAGPQEENLYGFNYLHNFNESLSMELEAGLSSYVPDRTATSYDLTVQGHLARFTLSYRKGPHDARLDIFHIASTYDPFVLQYPQPTNTPTFLPFGAYYTNYWQMHDYVTWPDNRVGARLTGNHNFSENTRLHYHLASYGQVDATAPLDANATAVKAGMVEPLFPVLKEGGTQKGNLLEAGFSLARRFKSGLTGSLSYYYFLTRRDAPNRDYINNRENYFSLDLSYPVNEWLKANAGYAFIDYGGKTGALENNFSQSIPYIGFNVKVREEATVSVTWRNFKYRDLITTRRDWGADQIITEYRCKF